MKFSKSLVGRDFADFMSPFLSFQKVKVFQSVLTILTKLRTPDIINTDAKTERCIFKTLKFRNRRVLFLPLTLQGGGHENRISLFIFSVKKCFPIKFMFF